MKDNIKKLGTKRVAGLTVTQIVILIVLIVMLFFFSDNSIPKRVKHESQIKELEAQIEFYQKQSEADKEKLDELKSNKGDLEKFARENYYMKKENEEIFIIEEN
ncbi:MAG: septum formation initiator family protein [Fermentimonas sp.]|jgi:cell division protein FtsB|nr:septum formation initiator family protein [Fermentimonas sp.]NLC86636.1 hypothetical protein [Bacteroidales bacterium]HBT84449.1 hypothetical protein [Porphyromonadaceae bacterium]MDD2930346.1 septum formation initiator family protein [Fermentimonas sp.]MDD3187988.1 septum formation initiator family protein [Fermentimonas sp.]